MDTESVNMMREHIAELMKYVLLDMVQYSRILTSHVSQVDD